MKFAFSSTIVLLGMAALPAGAMPLAVGTVSDNVGFSEASDFSGGFYGTLTQRHIEDYPNKVVALIFATPW